jgi:hypothetical protein
MKFAQAIKNQSTTTTNGMPTRVSSADPIVTLFYKIGASRGKDITPEFSAAMAENPDLAVRTALWARDVRGGAGERKLFRDICGYLEQTAPDVARRVMVKIPELGRFDDLFAFRGILRNEALTLFANALREGNGLASKWAPREKSAQRKLAVELMQHMGLKPKEYRKMIVAATNVVETAMCARDWDNINFSHVPSVAASRYRTAFWRNTPLFEEYVNKLVAGDKSVKVTASSVFPHDVIKGAFNMAHMSPVELDHIRAQWAALPNFIEDASILPMVDVSGSMNCSVGNSNSLRCIDVAVSLGLYCADKNTGAFKDCTLTFTGNPQLVQLTGDIISKINQLVKAEWQMNTNIEAAFRLILRTAIENSVPAEEMPRTLLILSDMQFDACCKNPNDSAIAMIRHQYEEAGYPVPNIVFWNLNAHANTPVRYDEKGTALVSGFSPSILKAVVSSQNYTPLDIVCETIMDPRYDF